MRAVNRALVFSWVLQLTACLILLRTLFWKFSGDEVCVWIFAQLDAEPWGRYCAATMELITVLLLLIPRTVAFGAFFASSLTAGAIVSHLVRLGIFVRNDQGYLFFSALAVFVCSLLVLWIRRGELGITNDA
ncbi:MAG: DoxX family protein [Spirochaetia bacterium]|nr:DoxX family protein [Spirochaetia bacterium]